MRCARCGRDNPMGAIFCIGCGAPMPQSPPQPQSPSQSAPEYKSQPQYQSQPNVPPTYYAQPVYGNQYAQPCSQFSRWLAFVLCFFVGVLGIHRFYVGKVGTGILYLCTGGLFGIGWLIDIIMIACGSFTDEAGFQLRV